MKRFFSESSQQIMYTFKNSHDEHGVYRHYIIIAASDELLTEELEVLGEILSLFPYANNQNDWVNYFKRESLINFPKKLLFLAANAYDQCHNTVLSVTTEYGQDLEAVQLLIDLGAKIDTPGRESSRPCKTALHWAIGNKLSCKDPSSMQAAAVVKLLIDHGASIDNVGYKEMTPLEYAKDKGFTAAVDIMSSIIHYSQLPPRLLPKMSLFSQPKTKELPGYLVTELQKSLLKGFIGF